MDASKDASMDDLYEVYHVLDRKIRSDVVYYKIQWKHYLPKYSTWEPESNLNGCAKMVEQFENKRVDKIIGENGDSYSHSNEANF